MNYDNITDDYIPNNLRLAAPTPRKIFDYEPPYDEYNLKGNFVGYSWHYGESLDLTLSISKTIYVEDSAIIYTETGGHPDDSRAGFIGQRAYNTADNKTWVCVALRMNEDGSNYKKENNEWGTTFIIYEDSFVQYIWQEEKNFTYPANGTKPIIVNSEKDIEVKSVECKIYNFRWEEMYCDMLPGASTVTFHITPDDSKKLIKGIYYVTFTTYGEDDLGRPEARFNEQHLLLVK